MKYKQKPDIVHETIDGEMILLHPDNGKMLVLNEAGTQLWHFLNDWLSMEDLVTRFTAVYEANPEQIHPDIGQFVDALNQKGLIDVQIQ